MIAPIRTAGASLAHEASTPLGEIDRGLWHRLTPSHRLQRVAAQSVVDAEPDLHWAFARDVSDHAVDVLVAGCDEAENPENMFDRVRWGGRLVCCGTCLDTLKTLAQSYQNRMGFVVEVSPQPLQAKAWKMPGMHVKGWMFIARRVAADLTGWVENCQASGHTFDLQLAPHAHAPGGYVLQKSIPSRDVLRERLAHQARKRNDVDEAALDQRVDKLLRQIMPEHLQREADALLHAAGRLSEAHRNIVPTLWERQPDATGKGLQTLSMSWMPEVRQTPDPFAFGLQAAERLATLHHEAGLLHLNIHAGHVLNTAHGPVFVDFTSALHGGPELEDAAHLRRLTQRMRQARLSARGLKRVLGLCDALLPGATTQRQHALAALDAAGLASVLQAQVGSDGSGRSLQRLTAAFLFPLSGEHVRHKSAMDLARGMRRLRVAA